MNGSNNLSSNYNTNIATFPNVLNDNNITKIQKNSSLKQKNESISSGINVNKVNFSNNTGGNVCQNKSIESIKIEQQEKEVLDNSTIDSVFEEENSSNIDTIGENIDKFIEDYKDKFLKSKSETTIKLEDLNRESCKNIVEKLFELQNLYYDDYNKANNLYQIFKDFLINYNENFRTLMKKNNRLNEAFETHNLKSEFANFINREENKIINENLNINRNELKIYKNIFGIEYQINDVLKYHEDLENKKCKYLIISIF
jgi:hypothetical protein